MQSSESTKVFEDNKLDSLDLKKCGNKAFDSQNYHDAVCHYIQALAKLNLHSEQDRSLLISIRSNLAATYIKLGEWSDAEVNCKLVLELDPNHVKSLYRLGIVAMKLGNFDESQHYLDKALQLVPGDKSIISAARNLKQKRIDFEATQKQMYQNVL
ncbi:hypothetical protein MIR68_011210 [Amoeboaphelidium protococcarum]|nr:hypothetical protein MIR68_011210 [Amoeboaphelidium protococcarum]